MKYLLDINSLIALAHQGHSHHVNVSRWFASLVAASDTVLTCAITELGFVRVSVQAGLADDIRSAQATLSGMVESSIIPWKRVADGVGVSVMPPYVKKPSQLTDGHLLELARKNKAAFATLDTGIPGSLRLP